MSTPFKKNLPYGLGIFTQYFQKEKIVWGYGQFNCYSSLFIKIPGKKLTFIIAANNNLISDPARTIYGDVTSSLFALCFLKNYVFGLQNMPLLEEEKSLLTLPTRINTNNSKFYLKKTTGAIIS